MIIYIALNNRRTYKANLLNYSAIQICVLQYENNNNSQSILLPLGSTTYIGTRTWILAVILFAYCTTKI